MKRRLLTAGLVFALPFTALAQDKSNLNDKDDIDFAKALVANPNSPPYPDLAEKLLNVVEKSGKAGDQAKAQITAIKLDVAQDAASKIEDPIKRKEALLKVLADKEKFIDEFKGKDAAEETRNLLPDLYNAIGEALTAAMKKEKDEKVLDSLRNEGDALFLKAEQAMKNRIAELKAIASPTPADEAKQVASRYNYPHTIYLHAQIFPAGSTKRTGLCTDALNEYGEFELDYGGDDPPLLLYYAYIDMGLCMKELGQFDDAVKSLEKTIVLRESWGPKDKAGVWPIPADAGQISDIVCYGILQKMIVLRDQKKLKDVIEVGKEYFSSMKKPFLSPSSMLLAKALCEAQIDTGDKGAADTAKLMIKEDEAGIGGVWGRDLLERMGGAAGTPYTDKLKTAGSKIAAKDYDRAITLCHQILDETAGTPDEQEAGCSALLLIGYSYYARGWVEEGALAYETAVNRFPKAKEAAEALSRAIDCYTAANRVARRKFYKDVIDAAKARLITDYPNAPQAAGIQMKNAQGLESEGDYLGAIDIYKKVEKTSANYTQALVWIGIDYFNHAIKLIQEKKPEDEKKSEEEKKADQARKNEAAKPFLGESEKALLFAIKSIQEHPQTMDPTILKAYEEQEYYSTLSLAKLYMFDLFNRAADASPVIDKLEAKFGKDPKKGPDIQNLRGKMFLSQGRIDEAEKWIEDLYKRDPKAAASPAGSLARALDEMGADKFKAKPDSIEGDEIWRRAGRFYWISIEPQVAGTVSQNAGEMTEVGNRIFVYGLHFNGVPADRENFVDFVPGPKRAADYFVRAAKDYEAALAQSPDYRMMINLGRAYGFLGKWTEAAGVYAKLFDQEQVLTKDKRKLDPASTKAKPELVPAYLEWGVAEQMAAQATNDKDRAARAAAIFDALSVTLKPDTGKEIYWGARYHQVRVRVDRGAYKDAQLTIDDIQRQVSPTFDEGKYGYKALFEATIEELKTKK